MTGEARRARRFRRSFPRASAAVLLATTSWLLGSATTAHGDAAMEPALIDFGHEQRGVESAPALVELVNTGRNPFRVFRTEVNSGPDNTDFVVVTDGCSGTDVEPGGRCPLQIAFRPTGAGPTSQTLGVDVSGPDYRTFGERAAVVTLNGVGTGDGPAPLVVPAPGSGAASQLPEGLMIPIAGAVALGLGILLLAAVPRALRTGGPSEGSSLG